MFTSDANRYITHFYALYNGKLVNRRLTYKVLRLRFDIQVHREFDESRENDRGRHDRLPNGIYLHVHIKMHHTSLLLTENLMGKIDRNNAINDEFVVYVVYLLDFVFLFCINSQIFSNFIVLCF